MTFHGVSMDFFWNCILQTLVTEANDLFLMSFILDPGVDVFPFKTQMTLKVKHKRTVLQWVESLELKKFICTSSAVVAVVALVSLSVAVWLFPDTALPVSGNDNDVPVFLSKTCFEGKYQ